MFTGISRVIMTLIRLCKCWHPAVALSSVPGLKPGPHCRLASFTPATPACAALLSAMPQKRIWSGRRAPSTPTLSQAGFKYASQKRCRLARLHRLTGCWKPAGCQSCAGALSFCPDLQFVTECLLLPADLLPDFAVKILFVHPAPNIGKREKRRQKQREDPG